MTCDICGANETRRMTNGMREYRLCKACRAVARRVDMGTWDAVCNGDYA